MTDEGGGTTGKQDRRVGCNVRHTDVGKSTESSASVEQRRQHIAWFVFMPRNASSPAGFLSSAICTCSHSRCAYLLWVVHKTVKQRPHD